MKISIAIAAAAMGLSALVPVTSYAATVGYHGNCAGDQAAAISAAGHTPVAVPVINSASLAGLDALMSENCQYTQNPDVDAAVNNGMVLIVHDWNVSGGPRLPGAPSVVQTIAYGADLDLPAASPIINGPGGTLTNASLDGGSWSNHGHTTLASLPAGSTVLNTAADSTQVVTFSYTHGGGRVIYSTTPLGYYFQGGGGAGVRANFTNIYAPNLINWAVGPQFTTCAAEGYTGAKLTLCRQVCEINQTPTRLLSLIKLYRSIYRADPPCAR